MRALLLIIALVLFPFLIYSQTTGKAKLISLKPNKEQVSNDDFYFRDFMDERTSTDYIGQVQKGLMNNQAPLNFKNPIKLEFLNYLNFLMRPAEEKTPLILVLHQLWATEKTTFTSEKGMLDITIEIRRLDDGQSLGTFSHYIENGGMDVTKGHEKRIRQGIVECLNKFFLSQKDASILFNDRSEKVDLSHGIPADLKKGFYINFANIEYNRPELDLGMKAKVKSVNEHVKRYIVTHADSKKKRKEYAYYSGKSLLLNAYSIGLTAAYYLEPHTDGRFLLYIDKYSRPGAAVAFGAIGAVTSAKTRPNVLDLKTGIIREVDEEYMNELLKNHPIIMQSYSQSDKDIPAIIEHIQALNEAL